jgi:hypothetical protein
MQTLKVGESHLHAPSDSGSGPPECCPPQTPGRALTEHLYQTSSRVLDSYYNAPYPVVADVQDLYAAPDTIKGADHWKLSWSYEQRAFSEYFRDGFVEGEDLIIASCADANDSMMEVAFKFDSDW